MEQQKSSHRWALAANEAIKETYWVTREDGMKGTIMLEKVKRAWHDYIGDAPVDDELYQAKICAFVTAWELCVKAHQDAGFQYSPSLDLIDE